MNKQRKALPGQVSRLTLALAAALASSLPAPTTAATRTWTGGDTTGSQWSSYANWANVGGLVTLLRSDDSLIYNNTKGLNPIVDLGVGPDRSFKVTDISFAAGAGAFNFGTVAATPTILKLQGNVANTSASAQTFSLQVEAIASGAQTWDGGSAGVSFANAWIPVNGGTSTLTLKNKLSIARSQALLGDISTSVGTLNITAGSSATTGTLTLGRDFGGQGSILVDGLQSALTNTGTLVVGHGSTGTITVQNSGTLTTGETFIGRVLGGDGLVLVSGSGATWASSGRLTVGDVGVGSLRVEAGGKLTSLGATLGSQEGSAGLVRVAGANSSWTLTGDLQIGALGEGTLNIEQAGFVSSQSTVIGQIGDAGTSRLLVSGTGSSLLNTANLTVQSGSVDIAAGAVLNARDVHLGEYGAAAAVLNLSGAGSVLNVNGGQLVLAGNDGSATVNLGTGATINSMGQLLLGPRGVLNLNGGTLNLGWSNNQGQVNWNTGTVHFLGAVVSGFGILEHSVGLGAGMNLLVDASLSIAAGDEIILNGGQAQAQALSLAGDVSVGTLSVLGIGSGGVHISGALQLAGGTVRSNGAIVNEGLLGGWGTLTGSASFTNNGLLLQGPGNLVLSHSGGSLNTGSWELQAGRSLSLATDLENQGAFKLGGGSVSGSGALLNGAQGTLSGSGRIATGSFLNQGSLVVDAGQLRIDPSFSNRGQILLGSNTAVLQGGQIGNHGLIQGLGRINSNISNIDPIASITAQGGTLVLGGLIVSPNAGLLAASNGATLLVSQGLASNNGRIQLTGGGFDNNNRTLDNEVAGVISGYGSLRGGLLTNKGRVLFSGGTSAVYTPVLSTAGSQIVASGNSNTSFYAAVDVQSGAELRVSTGSVATFFELVQQRTGAKFTGAGAKRFEAGVSVGASPGLGTDEGDVEFGESNFYIAEIGGLTACTLACGTDAVFRDHSFDKYIVAGSLSFGGELRITSWNGFVAQAGQRFDLFDWGTTTGGFSSIDASGFKLAAGTKLDYSALYTTGEIAVTTAVPEPETYALLLAGLGVIGFVARRRR